MFHPQGNSYPQGSSFPQFGAGAGYTPFANTPYGFGFPQQAPNFSQGFTPSPQLLQQQAIQQLLAQQLGMQNSAGLSGGAGLTNGAIPQAVGTWPQQVTHGPHAHVLQQLAQTQYLIAQQLAQLAAQQITLGGGNPYAGQYGAGQVGASYVPGVPGYMPGISNYVPGLTMH
jgi:hypothetical protein